VVLDDLFVITNFSLSAHQAARARNSSLLNALLGVMFVKAKA
jgi:hypothetical protein